jgi:hypothetical protein
MFGLAGGFAGSDAERAANGNNNNAATDTIKAFGTRILNFLGCAAAILKPAPLEFGVFCFNFINSRNQGQSTMKKDFVQAGTARSFTSCRESGRQGTEIDKRMERESAKEEENDFHERGLVTVTATYSANRWVV